MYLFSSKTCANCIFHREGPTPFSGICLNRDWQPKEGVIRLVRDHELACYGGWGVDSFQPRGPRSGPEGEAGGGHSGGPGGSGGSGGVNGRYIAQAGGRVLSPEVVDKLLGIAHSRSPRPGLGDNQLPLWEEDLN